MIQAVLRPGLANVLRDPQAGDHCGADNGSLVLDARRDLRVESWAGVRRETGVLNDIHSGFDSPNDAIHRVAVRRHQHIVRSGGRHRRMHDFDWQIRLSGTGVWSETATRGNQLHEICPPPRLIVDCFIGIGWRRQFDSEKMAMAFRSGQRRSRREHSRTSNVTILDGALQTKHQLCRTAAIPDGRYARIDRPRSVSHRGLPAGSFV